MEQYKRTKENSEKGQTHKKKMSETSHQVIILQIAIIFPRTNHLLDNDGLNQRRTKKKTIKSRK